MTDKDICLEYSQAKDKAAQIGILADLNQCDVSRIVDILRNGGVLEKEPKLPATTPDRCRQVLEAHRLSQAKFCRMYGLNQSTFSLFINNPEKGTSQEMVGRIAAAIEDLAAKPIEPKAKPKPQATPQPKPKPQTTPQSEGITLTREEAIVLGAFLEQMMCRYAANHLEYNVDLRDCLLKMHRLTGIYKRLTEGNG